MRILCDFSKGTHEEAGSFRAFPGIEPVPMQSRVLRSTSTKLEALEQDATL